MKEYYYLSKDIGITTILEMYERLRRSKTIREINIISDVRQFTFGIRAFNSVDWTVFHKINFCPIRGYFNPSIESINKVIDICKAYSHRNMDSQIHFDAKGVKSRSNYPCSFSISIKNGVGSFHIIFQDNSPYRTHNDKGKPIKDNKMPELCQFMDNLLGKPNAIDSRDSVNDIPLTELNNIIIKTYEFLGEKILSIHWFLGLGRDDNNKLIEHLNCTFKEKPCADWYEVTFNCIFKSYEACEELRKVIDHKTSILIPISAWLLKDHPRNPEGLTVGFRVMEKGYQFLALCHQPLHAGAVITPEMQSFLNDMGVDTTKPLALKDIQEEPSRY